MNKTDQSPEPDQQTIFLTVREAAYKVKVFSESAIRTQIFLAEQNGLDKAEAIKRVGRRVLIHYPKYLAWIDSHSAIAYSGLI